MDDTNKLSEEVERERFETRIKNYPELLGRNRAGTQGYYEARTYWAWRGWCSAKADASITGSAASGAADSKPIPQGP